MASPGPERNASVLWDFSAVEKSHKAQRSRALRRELPARLKLRKKLRIELGGQNGNGANRAPSKHGTGHERCTRYEARAVKLERADEDLMAGFTSRTLSCLAPFLGVALFSRLASAKIVTESWQIKGVRGAADQGKVRFALAQLPSLTNPLVTPSLVRVTFDDQKLRNAQIQQAVAKAGHFELIGKPMLAHTLANTLGAKVAPQPRH